MDLYNESEGYQVETEMSNTLILMLKQSDWFKEATKCLESKKFSIKIAKKVLCNSSSIFSKEYIVNEKQSEIEQEYFMKISLKQSYLYDEILLIYDKFNNIMSKFNEYKLGLKSDFDDIEEIIHQVELNNNCDEILELIQKYEDWKNIVKLAINDSKNVSQEIFTDLQKEANTFPFRTIFLENFKKILLTQNQNLSQSQNLQKDYNQKGYLNMSKEVKESKEDKLIRKNNESQYHKQSSNPIDYSMSHISQEDSEKDNASMIKISLDETSQK